MAKPKVRLHKGLSAELRRRTKAVGARLDEENAQLALNGFLLARDPVLNGHIATAVDMVTEQETSARLRSEWEAVHPGQRPYPPPFAEVLREDLQSLLGLMLSGADPELAEDRITTMIAKCNQELKDDDEDD